MTLSRRRFLAAGAASVAGMVLGARELSAQAVADPTTALAFDGDKLVIAGGRELRRLDRNGSWVPLTALGKLPVLALATHARRPGLIVAGSESGTVTVSVDRGLTWEERSSGLPGGRVAALTVAATRPKTFYAAVADDGLWQSEDDGESWSLTMDRPWLEDEEQDLLAVASVELATGMGGIWIYAGTNVGLTRVPDCFCRWQDVEPADAMDALASGSAPVRTAPLPDGEPVRALVSASARPQTLYVATASGVWRSEDAGLAWSRLIEGPSSTIAVHQTNPARVVAEIAGALHQTADSGAVWSPLTPPNGALQ